MVRHVMLDSLFTDEAALAYYADHPEHVKCKGYIGGVTKSRKCVDYLI